MTTTVEKPRGELLGTRGPGATIPFDSICEPGAYVCRWSGHLLRVGAGGIRGRTPCVSVIGRHPLMVTKIDDDPAVSVAAARLQAANADVPVRF